jgi:transposase
MLAAIIEGETDPERLADLARGNARHKRRELIESLHGRVTPHHRALLKLHLDLVNALQIALKEVDEAVGKALAPISYAAELLKTMPGVSDVVANVILSEIGADMSRFPTAGHLISWAGLCPRSDQSAGKRRSTRIRKGGPWLKTTLVTAAWAAVRTKDSYLRTQFLRLKSRRGPKKAILAVAASMLTAAYHMLRDAAEYNDLGPQHFERDKARVISRLVKRLQDLGCEVELKAAA